MLDPHTLGKNCRRKVGAVPPTKIGGQKTFAFAPFFDDFEIQWQISTE